MAYTDEEILQQRAAVKEMEQQRFSQETIEENEQSIFDGKILINKVPVTFAERTLMDGKIAIWLPEDYEELSTEAIELLYPLGNKPDFVLGNTYLSLSVGFRYMEQEIPDEHIKEFIEVVKLILDRVGPKNQILSENVCTVGRHTVSSLDFCTNTLTGDNIYNKMFFSSLEGRVLMGFMNFSYTHLDRYKKIVEEIMQSFRFVEDGEV